MQNATRGNMSVASRIPNVAILGLVFSLCLFSDRGLGLVVTAEQIVDTDPHVVLEVGTKGILPCRIQRRALSVEWKRQLSSGTELLVFLDLFFTVGKRDGSGYETGLFNITDDYSLLIKDVKVEDEGLYMCSFSDSQTGKTFKNSTRVSVQAFPDEPFPVIQECSGKDEISGVCTLTVHSTSNITCFARGYYPDIDLFFLRGSEKVTSTEYEEWNNADGTKYKSVRIPIRVSDEPYQCVASRLPVTGGNRSVTVIVQTRSQAHSQGPVAVAVVVPVIVGICLSIAAIFRYGRGNGRGWCSKHEYNSVAQGNPSTYPTVEPDHAGYYNQKMKQAKPSVDQLDPNKSYKMDLFKKGHMFLFNMTKGRPGSEIDVKNIEHVFKEIGYEIQIYSDLTAKELKDRLKKFVNSPLHKDMCSTVVMLMGYGNSRGIACSGGEEVTMDFVKEKICGMQSMVGKPKMIFFQCSRTGSSARGGTCQIDSTKSDVLIVHATADGGVSYRNTNKCTWFIQMLCEVLLENAHESDLSSMLDQVTGKVGKMSSRGKYLQCPVVVKQGISKKIYFLPKYPPQNDSA